MTSDADLNLFITRQLHLLSQEKEAEVERTSLLISKCSHKLLEQRGLALGGLGVASVAIGLGGKSLIELERPSAYHATVVFPPHTLRPGDLARIDEYTTNRAVAKKSTLKAGKEPVKSINGVVYKVSDVRIVFAVDSSSSGNDELDIPEKCTLIKLTNTVTHDRMRRAMEQLQSLVSPNQDCPTPTDTKARPSSLGLNSLHKVLLGLSKPSNYFSASQSTVNHFFDSSLNAFQIAAVKFSLTAAEVACIHGPPGTGKTRVLVEVIRQLVYRPNEVSSGDQEISGHNTFKIPAKILVCGASNLAVDNLLERLSLPTPLLTKPPTHSTTIVEGGASSTPIKYYPSIALTRLGHPARVMSSLHSKTLDAQAEISEEAALVKDVKTELEEILSALSGKRSKGTPNVPSNERGRGTKLGTRSKGGDVGRTTGARKGQILKGEERKEAWKNIRDLRKEYRKREERVIKSVLSKAQVILATCHGAGSRQLQNMEFDVVIIDEATQALEAVCWIPALKGKKLILAGDPMQLGPTIISEPKRRHVKHPKVTQKNAEKSSFTVQKDAVKAVSMSQISESVMTPIVHDNEGTEDSNISDDNSSASDSSSSERNEANGPENEIAKEQAKTKSLSRPLLPPKSLRTTMFDRLETMYGGTIKRTLDIQYRMNTKISEFPSKTLYHSRLTPHASNASRLLCHLPGVSREAEYADVVGTGSEVVFWDTAGAEFWERSGNNDVNAKSTNDDGASLCNENEAEVVKRWVDRLMAAGVRPSQIAIITPYQAQSQMLSTMLPEPELEIGTADGMQGRENEAVILSLVRSNPMGEVGFLKEKRRLNVAMTRAKSHLCVVGDSSTIRRGGKYLTRWMDWLENEGDVRFAGDL